MLPKQELFLLNRTTLLITGESRSMTLIIFSLLKNVNRPRAIEISLRIHQKNNVPRRCQTDYLWQLSVLLRVTVLDPKTEKRKCLYKAQVHIKNN